MNMTEITKNVIREDLTELENTCLRCREYVNNLPESDIKYDLDLIVFAATESVKTYQAKFGFCPDN